MIHKIEKKNARGVSRGQRSPEVIRDETLKVLVGYLQLGSMCTYDNKHLDALY